MQRDPSFQEIASLAISTPTTPFIKRTPKPIRSPEPLQNTNDIIELFAMKVENLPSSQPQYPDVSVSHISPTLAKHLSSLETVRSHWFLRLQAMTNITKMLMCKQLTPEAVKDVGPRIISAALLQCTEERSTLIKEVNNIITSIAQQLGEYLQPMSGEVIKAMSTACKSMIGGVTTQANDAIRNWLQNVSLSRDGWNKLRTELPEKRIKHESIEVAVTKLAELCDGVEQPTDSFMESLAGFVDTWKAGEDLRGANWVGFDRIVKTMDHILHLPPLEPQEPSDAPVQEESTQRERIQETMDQPQKKIKDKEEEENPKTETIPNDAQTNQSASNPSGNPQAMDSSYVSLLSGNNFTPEEQETILGLMRSAHQLEPEQLSAPDGNQEENINDHSVEDGTPEEGVSTNYSAESQKDTLTSSLSNPDTEKKEDTIPEPNTMVHNENNKDRDEDEDINDLIERLETLTTSASPVPSSESSEKEGRKGFNDPMEAAEPLQTETYQEEKMDTREKEESIALKESSEQQEQSQEQEREQPLGTRENDAVENATNHQNDNAVTDSGSKDDNTDLTIEQLSSTQLLEQLREQCGSDLNDNEEEGPLENEGSSPVLTASQLAQQAELLGIGTSLVAAEEDGTTAESLFREALGLGLDLGKEFMGTIDNRAKDSPESEEVKSESSSNKISSEQFHIKDQQQLPDLSMPSTTEHSSPSTPLPNRPEFIPEPDIEMNGIQDSPQLSIGSPSQMNQITDEQLYALLLAENDRLTTLITQIENQQERTEKQKQIQTQSARRTPPMYVHGAVSIRTPAVGPKSVNGEGVFLSPTLSPSRYLGVTSSSAIDALAERLENRITRAKNERLNLRKDLRALTTQYQSLLASYNHLKESLQQSDKTLASLNEQTEKLRRQLKDGEDQYHETFTSAQKQLEEARAAIRISIETRDIARGRRESNERLLKTLEEENSRLHAATTDLRAELEREISTREQKNEELREIREKYRKASERQEELKQSTDRLHIERGACDERTRDLFAQIREDEAQVSQLKAESARFKNAPLSSISTTQASPEQENLEKEIAQLKNELAKAKQTLSGVADRETSSDPDLDAECASLTREIEKMKKENAELVVISRRMLNKIKAESAMATK